MIQSQKTTNLAGVWNVTTGDGKMYDCRIPGTLDESSIGDAMDPEYAGTGDTRKYTFRGPVRFSRTIVFHETPGKRCFLEVERGRELALFVDGDRVDHFTAPVLSAPHVFEVTGLINGTHTLTLISDNSYLDLPPELSGSCLTADGNSTNWNGLLGYVRLREETETFLERVTIYPSGKELSVFVEISAGEAGETVLAFASDVLKKEYRMPVNLKKGYSSFMVSGLRLLPDAERWDEGKGVMHELSVSLYGNPRVFPFGIRSVSQDESGRLCLNGRRIFLRGETDAAVWPETGYEPCEESTWKRTLSLYRDYGVNFVRFASHCPPDAAFRAADELGMMLMPELPMTGEALTDDEALSYYKVELSEILRTYGNHPSFLMLGLGESLTFSEDAETRKSELISLAHQIDAARIVFDPEDASAPKLLLDVSGPEFYPDLNEHDLFSGPVYPTALERIRQNASDNGLLTLWNRLMSAAGTYAFRYYRKAISDALLQETNSGIVLRGLMDYPGDRVRFKGMMNSHMQAKPFREAEPKVFSQACAPLQILILPERYTYEYCETVTVRMIAANYTLQDITDTPVLTILTENGKERISLDPVTSETGGLTELGTIELPKTGVLSDDSHAARITLTASFGKQENSCHLFLYPPDIPICPENIYETDVFDYRTREVLEKGGMVFLTPDATDAGLPGSACFSNPGGPENISGVRTLQAGQFIDVSHPLFQDFPTEAYSEEQWEPLLAGGRALVMPRKVKTIIAAPDRPDGTRFTAQLVEFRCLNGTVLLSTLALQDHMMEPQVRALLSRIYDYMSSYDFSPSETLRTEEVRALVRMTK